MLNSKSNEPHRPKARPARMQSQCPVNSSRLGSAPSHNQRRPIPAVNVRGLTPTLLKLLRSIVLMGTITSALMTAYVVKSALGINVFPGRSPIVHDLLYPMAVTLKAAIKTASPV